MKQQPKIIWWPNENAGKLWIVEENERNEYTPICEYLKAKNILEKYQETLKALDAAYHLICFEYSSIIDDETKERYDAVIKAIEEIKTRPSSSVHSCC